MSDKNNNDPRRVYQNCKIYDPQGIAYHIRNYEMLLSENYAVQKGPFAKA